MQRLREAVAVQSVSAWPEKRGEIVKMVKHVAGVSTFMAPERLSPRTSFYLEEELFGHIP